jgi:hypothetical protein
VLAAYLYIQSSPTPVKIGDGAIVGGLAGVIGGVIYFVLSLPINIFFGMAAMEAQLERSGIQLPFSGMVLLIISSLLGAVILAVLTALGGLLGVAIFEKRKDGAAPPPPQNFA